MLKKILKFAWAGLAIIGCVIVLNYMKNCKHKYTIRQNPVDSEYRIPEETYREPIVTIPVILPDKPPIAESRLPIPKKQVSKSIALTDTESGRTIELIIDKKGGIYFPTDTQNIKAQVTIWKPKLVEVGTWFGYTGVYSGSYYHCFSLDLLRVGNFKFGSDVGTDSHRLLIGLSCKYPVISIGTTIHLALVGGWNFMGNKPYFGGNLQW